MRYRRLAMAGGWLLAAVVATGIGIAAVGVIARGLTDPQGELMTAEEISRQLASAPSSAAPSAPPSPATPSPTGPASRHFFTTPGGTVLAECDGQIAELISWSPASGYRLGEVDQRRGPEAELSFQRGEDEVEVKVTCAGGVPQLELDD